MNLYVVLFYIFFKIGAFTFGGGYAMLPLIEAEIVHKRGWIDPKEFLDLVALAQSAPGIMAVNIAIFVGYKLKGVSGAVICTLGAALPSFIIILLIALFFRNFRDNETVGRVFKGIRPAVVALIAVPVFQLAKKSGMNRYTCWIAPATALLVWLFHVSPAYIILLAVLGGWVWGVLVQRRNI